jgi:hypothetical protein
VRGPDWDLSAARSGVVPLEAFTPEEQRTIREAGLVAQGEGLVDPATGEVSHFEGVPAAAVLAERDRRAEGLNPEAIPLADIVRNVEARLADYRNRLAGELARGDDARAESVTALTQSIDRDLKQLERLNARVAAGDTHVVGPLFHPINVGVDPELQVPIIDAGGPAPKAGNLRELRREAVRIAGEHVGRFVNEDTGWTVSISDRGARHVAQDHPDERNYPAMVQAMRRLGDIVKGAVLVETHPDLKNQAGVAQVHRLYAPVRVGDAVYVVKLTVKEAAPGEMTLEQFRLYDLKSEKKMPTGTSTHPPDVRPASSWPAVGTSGVPLRDMLSGVKDNAGQLFFQTAWLQAYRLCRVQGPVASSWQR